VNDIDSLLEELCEYENTLNRTPANNLFLSQTNLKANQKPKTYIEDNRNISKQFDDVLKLISDSIDEPLNITIIQNQNDSQYTSSINSSPKSQENISSSCSTSSSSGIIDDDLLKNSKAQSTLRAQLSVKRNSSDSAFSDSISFPSSKSIGTIKQCVKNVVDSIDATDTACLTPVLNLFCFYKGFYKYFLFSKKKRRWKKLRKFELHWRKSKRLILKKFVEL
jgi:hypothetical protein